MTTHTWLVEIPEGECAALLAGSVLGRLGVVVDGRPEIFPVNHVYDERTGTIVFPTNERTKWRAALDWPWVAFEIDGMDPDHAGGWSVAVVGRAEEVIDAAEIARATQRRAEHWGVPPATHWLRIVPDKVTGWRISGPPGPSPRA